MWRTDRKTAAASPLCTPGLEKSLAVIREIEHMARETTEGQAIELNWVRSGATTLGVRAYFWMTKKKKTCWQPVP